MHNPTCNIQRLNTHLKWHHREMFVYVLEVKKTQALRCPPMTLNHPLVEQMTRWTPFQCPPAVTLPACPPRVTFWCPTLLFLVCLVNNNTVFQMQVTDIDRLDLLCVSVFLMPQCDKYRLRFLERHSVRFLVRRDSRPHSWGKCCYRWLGHNVNDGELLLLLHTEPVQLSGAILNPLEHLWFHHTHIWLLTAHFQVNHEVSQNSAKGLYKQMPGSFNFLRKHLFFQTQL